MKCILCNSDLEEKLIDYEEFGEKLGRFKAKVCKNCGEEFFDSATVDKIQTISKKRGLFGIIKRVKVAEVGNSIAIRIPKEIAEMTNLKKGKEVLIMPKSKSNISLEF